MTETNGQFRKKRIDDTVKSIEKKYGRDFGVRSNAKMESNLKRQGFGSLCELFRSDARKQDKKK